MIKLKEVAERANVSTATVSRVLSNTGKVTEKTRKKVLAAMEELNYQPNFLARQLRKLETKTILVVVPDIANTFFSKVIRGIESVALQNDYQVLLGDSQNNSQSESQYLNHLRYKQVDGVILLTARTDSRLIEDLSDDYPVVLACEYLEGSRIPTVSIDNISSARKITDHLIKQGHQRIAHISGPMNIILGRDRLKGYEQAMTQNRYEIDQVLVQEGDFSYESGYKLMEKFLALQNPPTAVFAANDEMAIGAIKAIKKHRLSVPEDIAVVGFDDIEMASIIEPELTTVAQPTFEIGSTAMDLLLCLMKKEQLTKKQYVLEDQLVIRQSCGANEM
ncbi:LacI family repressor for deo operon, udp, cdd, tsx, nupC, and nupG [Bacillus pakistanensis]|uniref:LacI family repressor for deo operon, udp, cdd, tsx, nupC, and nupG n=1 Tax=Rossellomorea pakistanensis TaxID=992288 RepID=A0ABS2NHN0_9BACI|nr:LacI family DNA-binding transcriptional regulator [Bacillus pakistanensis]MBM7587333.1 LacI family repressor for deo operon, udp, cdd, tsx, nupC, and nupG [Bacillus pakistanensis]